MSTRHLPAGQNMKGGGPVGVGGGGGDAVQAGYNGGAGGPRRRPPPHHHQHPQQYMPHYAPPQMGPVSPVAYNYMGYPPQGYYGMPPQYPNGGYQGGGYQNAGYQNGGYPNTGMPSPGYMPYQQSYARSPSAMQQFVPMMGVSVPPNNYSRPSPQQQSPALSTPYQPPQHSHVPIPPQTPSSTHSSQLPPPPTPPTPQSIQPSVSQSSATSQSAIADQVTPVLKPTAPPHSNFRPPLPWFSCPDDEFPTRTARSRRRRPAERITASVSLPIEKPDAVTEMNEQALQQFVPSALSPSTGISISASQSAVASAETPRPAAAAVPAVFEASHGSADKPVEADEAQPKDDGEAAPEPAPVRMPPTSWANLFAKPKFQLASQSGVNSISDSGNDADGTTGVVGAAASAKANARSLAEAIREFRVDNHHKVTFLEPRGLINTGNMCYMNSVLQVLMFCEPFYDLLSQVGQKAAHSFKSSTPLIDAMIMFLHEYKVIRSASSMDQLRRTLKPDELEKYGEPFTPEFVYEAIRQLSRFASMRRGHQQDAEEFLGFLLQSLDDECTQVMNQAPIDDIVDTASEGSADPSGDWLEVGRKQRAAVTRSAGSSSSTPINKIFGGLLRSEFRVPGLKDSITTEPYQPLQLDIGSPDVRNVVDALRGLTRPERLQGDFNSPRGKDVMAIKQVFIETLPPVLILHLKRFQFDAEGNGTVKIWKKVGYPLELEIPREALSRQKRQTMGDKVMPKYKLISVVYHHGKNASQGHYTTDVRRQDDNEWIRLDDTIIRRIRAEDVAETGSEEEQRASRKGSPQPSGSGVNTSANRFGGMNDEDEGDEDEWKEVTGPSAGNKKQWSNVVNGSAQKGKQAKENVKDNKVAYLLFYRRV